MGLAIGSLWKYCYCKCVSSLLVSGGDMQDKLKHQIWQTWNIAWRTLSTTITGVRTWLVTEVFFGSLYHVFPPPDVIHTVGPMARGRAGPSESSDLSSSYQNSLKLLVENNLTTVVSAALRWELQCLCWSFKGRETLSCNFGKRKLKDFQYKMLNMKRFFFFTNHKCSIKSTFMWLCHWRILIHCEVKRFHEKDYIAFNENIP